MGNGKKPIHTTISDETMNILDAWEIRDGMLNNDAIDSAIALMEVFCQKNCIAPKEVQKFIKQNGFGTNLGISFGKFTTKIESITHAIYNGHKVGTIEIKFGSNGIIITQQFSQLFTSADTEELFGSLLPKFYHIIAQGDFGEDLSPSLLKKEDRRT